MFRVRGKYEYIEQYVTLWNSWAVGVYSHGHCLFRLQSESQEFIAYWTRKSKSVNLSSISWWTSSKLRKSSFGMEWNVLPLCKVTLKFVIRVRNRSSCSSPGSLERSEKFFVLLIVYSGPLVALCLVIFFQFWLHALPLLDTQQILISGYEGYSSSVRREKKPCD